MAPSSQKKNKGFMGSMFSDISTKCFVGSDLHNRMNGFMVPMYTGTGIKCFTSSMNTIIGASVLWFKEHNGKNKFTLLQ
jgi:hypothetical protein